MGLEDSGVSDPATGKSIVISVTIRKFYRSKYGEAYGKMPNVELNKIIGEEFAKCSSNVAHYFKIKEKRGITDAKWGEIRKGNWSNRFFISLLSDKIYVITMQDGYKSLSRGGRKKPENNSDDPILLIDSLRRKRNNPTGLHSQQGEPWKKVSTSVFPGLTEVPGMANPDAASEYVDFDDLYYFFGGKSDPFESANDFEEEDNIDEFGDLMEKELKRLAQIIETRGHKKIADTISKIAAVKNWAEYEAATPDGKGKLVHTKWKEIFGNDNFNDMIKFYNISKNQAGNDLSPDEFIKEMQSHQRMLKTPEEKVEHKKQLMDNAKQMVEKYKPAGTPPKQVGWDTPVTNQRKNITTPNKDGK